MKLKLSNSEMLAITSLLHSTCEKYATITMGRSSSMEERLHRSIFEEMWVEFQKKSFKRQDKYCITLKPSWACELHLEFSGILDQSTYEGNLIQRICDRIHQQLQ